MSLEEFIELVRTDAGLLISTAALIVATLSFLIALCQGWRARKHDRLSVKPLLHFYSNAMPDKPICITVKNSGVGPAIITNFTWLCNDGTMKKSRVISKEELYRSIKPPVPGGFTTPNKGTVISAGEEIVLAKCIDDPCTTEEDWLEALRMLSKVEVKIKYQSIYCQKFKSNYYGENLKFALKNEESSLF